MISPHQPWFLRKSATIKCPQDIQILISTGRTIPRGSPPRTTQFFGRHGCILTCTTRATYMHENRKEVVTVHSTHSGRGILLVFFRKKSQRTKNLVCGHIHAHLQKGNKNSIGVGCHIDRKKNNFGWTTRRGIFGRENTLRGFFGRENTQDFFFGQRDPHTRE